MTVSASARRSNFSGNPGNAPRAPVHGCHFEDVSRCAIPVPESLSQHPPVPFPCVVGQSHSGIPDGCCLSAVRRAVSCCAPYSRRTFLPGPSSLRNCQFLLSCDSQCSEIQTAERSAIWDRGNMRQCGLFSVQSSAVFSVCRFALRTDSDRRNCILYNHD
jgi:hypothetical protein